MSRLDEIRADVADYDAASAAIAGTEPGTQARADAYIAREKARDLLVASTPRALAHLLAEVERLTGERDADAQDAARWRSLWACERIRFVGGASLGTPEALFGADFHRKHPARDDAQSRALLLAFVDEPIERANFAELNRLMDLAPCEPWHVPPEVPDASVASEGPAKDAGSSIGYRWTEAPWGSYPVQGHLELADGRIGYYRSRGGNTTVELWPAGTTWPESGDLPAEDGDERDLSAYVVEGSRPEDDETTADGIVARWLAAGAP